MIEQLLSIFHQYFGTENSASGIINIVVLTIGGICTLYILLFILRHILFYYIVKGLKNLSESVSPKNELIKKEDQTDREDELLRNEEKERLATLTRDSFQGVKKEKEKDLDEPIHVEIQTVGERKTTERSNKQLPEQQGSRIVGIVDKEPIGRFTRLVLGREKAQIAQMLQNMASNGQNINKGYWVMYVEARKAAESKRKNQQNVNMSL